MKRKMLFLITGFTLLFAGCLISIYYFKGTKAGTSASGVLFAFERNYLPADSLKFVRKFECLQDGWKVLSFKDDLFLQMWKGQSLLRIDSLGKANQRFGRFGGGVGEFKQIVNISFMNSTIGITDSRRMVATEMSITSGQVLKTYQFDRNISGAAMIVPGLYIIRHFNSVSPEQEEYTITNFATNKSRKVLVPRFEKSKALDPTARDVETSGYFISRSDGRGALYVCSSAGQFIAFDSLGNLIYRQHTIDQSTVAESETKHAGEQAFTMNISRSNNINACADENYLYILSNAKAPDIAEYKEGENASAVIDIYSLKDGHYLLSIKVPAPRDDPFSKGAFSITSIAVHHNHLYIVQGINVFVYFFPRPHL